MNLNNELLDQIETLAYRLMKPSEIALILGLDSGDFMIDLRNHDTAISERFFAGYLKAKSEINLSIVTHATAGSSPAQTLASKFITDIEISINE